MRLLGLVLAVVVQSAIAQDALRLRRAEPAPVGQVQQVGPQGVVVGSSAVAPVLVPWARVLEVGGEWRGRAASYREIADLAWRADLRLARGDTHSAETMYERLLELLGTSQGPTTLAALGGLMHCQLDRGARPLALETWSRWVDAAGSQPGTAVYRRRGGAAAEEPAHAGSPLLPDLPPLWLDEDDTRLFAALQQEDTLNASDQPDPPGSKGAQLLMLYRLAAQIALGQEPPMPTLSGLAASEDPEVRLVYDLVAAQHPARETSRPARVGLEQRLESGVPAWQEAWIRVALGRSLVAEDEIELRERGVVHLLHVPSRLGVVSAGLVRVALSDAAAALETMGDERARAVVLNELRRVNEQMMLQEESVP